ncbi:glycosyl hydrolase family 65 protein [Streptomyces sp. NPDC050287]|uniref:glycosyl hydrolase family 65 protein n=1 Tax=Streptomyces sp. NPDC050287 TaxID=3365608 RepID=UPI0037AC69BE
MKEKEYGEAVGDIGMRLGASRRRSAWARFTAAATTAVSAVISPGDRAGADAQVRFRTTESVTPSATVRPHARARTTRRTASIGLALAGLLLSTAAVPALSAPEPGKSGSDDGWVLSTTDTSKNYAPTFVGNGYLAARVPAAGHGYGSTPIATQSELAGFYGAPWEGAEERASLPTWTTLGFGGSGSGGVYGIGSWSCGFNQLCPAAYGKISGGAFVENSHPGGIVGGYLAGLNTGGPTVGGTGVVPIRDAPAGKATLAIRYSNGSGDPQTIHVGVNGTLQQLTVPSTGSWDSWAVMTVPVTLTAGDNTLEITVKDGDTARVNVDYLAAYPEGAQPPTDIAPITVGTTSKYRQSLDLRTGVLSTSFDWTSPEGDTTSFAYEVNANRAEGHLGTVNVRVVPHWSGTATVVDEFDGRGLHRASTTDPHVNGKAATLSQTVVTDGKLATAGLNSVLRIDDKAVPTKAMAVPDDGSAAQSAVFPVRAGQTYRITKYVGIASSIDTDRSLKAATPQQAAASTAARAAKAGYQQLLARNDKEWSRLWQSGISIPGDTAMTAQIHASMFYLLASMRPGVTWSTSPGGLSSDGYSGHVFWDMETWMYPALLAQYPDIANGANSYRQKLLSAAEANAAKLSTPSQPIKGAKFAWESALTGKETAPDPWGTYEIHINSDIALAQWQYYQASGDKVWLRDKAWPVLKGIADYWATRAVPNSSGGYDINGVMGPDEYNYPVDNSATTNAGAQESLRIATRAAQLVGRTADPAWKKVADGLKIPVDTKNNIHPEFDGYDGQTVKQADITLLQYPWGVPMSAGLAQNDLDYYKEHTDPGGPSMTDAIAAINGAALGSPGCQVYDYLRNSAEPYQAAPFNQWYETRNGGAFNFTTGQGGYLQEFLYGFTGMRWGTDAITIDPFLPPQLPGVNITGVKWQGRTFDLSVGQKTTKLTLRSGTPLPVRVGIGSDDVRKVKPGTSLQVPTRHPAGDATQCDS